MNVFGRVLSFALVVMSAVFVPLIAYPETKKLDKKPIKTEEYKAAVVIWHIDTFEGGIGSRADFLSGELSKRKDDGIVTLVKTHTVESMEAAFKKGEYPDVVSYGIGAKSAIKFARELPFKNFEGGEFGGKYYAVPWLFGGYYLIEKGSDNRLIDMVLRGDEAAESILTIVSQGENTMPVLAMKFDGIIARNAEYFSPQNAYTKFLSEENAILLGTQRDLRRLEKRNVAFFAKPVQGYSDIVQYLSITAKSDEKYKYALKIVEYILSESVQKDLGKIGMMRVDGGENGAEFYGYDFSKNEYVASPFLSSEIISRNQISINLKKTDDKISDNLKSGLKRLK